jgi:hypothetical protein
VADQNLTVRVQAKTEGQPAKPFEELARSAKQADQITKQLAADAEKGFDGITKAIRLSNQAMAQHADHVKFASSQHRRFAGWAGAAAARAPGEAGGAAVDGAGSLGGLNAQAMMETFQKIAHSGRAVVLAFDAISGGDNSRSKLRQSGELGNLSANLADVVEDLFDRSGIIAHDGSRLAQWRTNSQQRKADRQEMEFLEADAFARPFQEGRRKGQFGFDEMTRRAEWEADAKARGDTGVWADLHVNKGMGIFYRDTVQKRLAAAEGAEKSFGSEGIRLGNQLTELRFAEDAQRKLLDSEQKRLELIKQQGRERQDQLKTQLESAKQEEARLRGVIDQEKSRLGGFSAEFGMLDPEQQRRARQLAQKASAGNLSRDELEEARQFGFLGETVQRQATRMGDAAGFQDVARLLGLDQKLRESEIAIKAAVEAQVDISNEIKISVDANAKLAEDAAEKVRQELTNLAAIFNQRIDAEIKKAQWIANKAQGG